MQSLLVRKIMNIGSGIYRGIVYPFVRTALEVRTKSVFGKKTYFMNGCSFEGRDFVGDRCELSNVHMGFSSMIGRDSVMSNTRIGRYTSIGQAETYIGRHPVKGENIATHPAFYSAAAQYGHTYVREDCFEENAWIDKAAGIQIDIGNDVWMGRGVAICDGVTVGDGAVIGAGSLVTGNVEPYAIYAGVPAKKIGQRFDDDTVAKLLTFRWWDKDEDWIREHAGEFKNPGEFLAGI